MDGVYPRSSPLLLSIFVVEWPFAAAWTAAMAKRWRVGCLLARSRWRLVFWRLPGPEHLADRTAGTLGGDRCCVRRCIRCCLLGPNRQLGDGGQPCARDGAFDMEPSRLR